MNFAVTSGEDAVGIGGPDEGFGIGICLFHETVDVDLEIENRAEHPAFDASPQELGEEAPVVQTRDGREHPQTRRSSSSSSSSSQQAAL
jgi:hypothetical protein